MRTPIVFLGISSVLCAAVVTGAGCSTSGAAPYATSTNPAAPTSSHLVQEGYQLDYSTTGGKTYLSPSGATTTFPASFQTLLKKNGGHLSSFIMPVDSGDKNTIYLSVSATTGSNPTYTVKTTILSYHLATGASKQLYQETAKNLELRTIGIDQDKLIVLPDPVDNSPGICTEIWYDYRNQLMYLNIAKPQEGLKPYNVPTEVVSAARKKEELCLKEMEASNK